MKKILIVEDEEFLLNEIASWLTYEGMKAIKASDGHSAIQLAQQEMPDLILSDILMPGMDGWTLLNAIRKLDIGEGIPFIFMSALSDRSDIRTGMETGADDYLTKPFSHSELLKAIATRLEKAESAKKQTDEIINNLQNRIITQLPAEISEPINSILGLSGLLAENSDNFSTDELSEMGRTLLERGRHLHRLAENYLMYVNIELLAEPPETTTTGTKLESVIFEEAYSIASRHQRADDLEVNTCPANLEIEERVLRKIIRELTDNAFRFSEPTSSVTITGTLSKDFYELVVKDHGEGIADGDIKRIGAYMQFSNRIPLKRGSGLGLIISKRLLEKYGGTMAVKSQLNTGTAVVCRIKASKNQ